MRKMLKWFKAHRTQIFAFLGCFVCLMGLMTIFVSAESPTTLYPNYPTYTDRTYFTYGINGISTKRHITNFVVEYRMSDSTRIQTCLSNINLSYTGSAGTELVPANSSGNLGSTRYIHIGQETMNEQLVDTINTRHTNGAVTRSQVTIYTLDSFAVAPTYDELTQSRQDRLILYYATPKSGAYRVYCEFHYVGNTNRLASSFNVNETELKLTYDNIIENSQGGSNSVPIIIDKLTINATLGALSTTERISIPYLYKVEQDVLEYDNEILYQNTLNDGRTELTFNSVVTAVGGFFDAPIFGDFLSLGAVLVALLSILLAIAVINALKG